MIRSEQIRAARALLDWSTADLAKLSGMTVNGLNKIERGHVDAHRATLTALARIFEENGVEFIGERGVALRQKNVQVFEGPGYYLRFLDYVCMHMHGAGEVLFINVDDSLSAPEIVAANERIRASGVTCKYLCPQNPTRIDYDPRDYRAIPAEHYRNGVQIIFGDCFATLVRKQFVLVIHNQDVADGARQLFKLVWPTLKMPEIKENRDA